MNVTSAQYLNDPKTGETNVNIRATVDGKEMFVPIDFNNRHYAEIKAKHDDPDDSFTIQDAD